jgi:thiol:disulfide interchange protein DsbA
MPFTFARRRFVFASAALLPLAALAQGRGAQPAEGVDYRLAKPAQPTDTGGRIEVLEFFQYSCPACYSFTPDLEAWRKRQGAAIEYRRLPINWDNSTVNHTRTYYTLEVMGLADKLHEPFFTAIHRNRRRMLEPNEIADFMAANGVDRGQWSSNFNSFAVNTRVARAGQVWRAFKVDSTPTVGIDGKFVTSPSMVGTREGVLATMDFLVARAQRERGGAAPAKK